MHLQLSHPVCSSRLLLRPLELGDVASLVAYRSLPEVCRFVPFKPMDAEVVRDRLEGSWSRHGLDGEGQALVLGIVRQAEGDLIGDMMLSWTSERHRSGEVGYVINPAYAGNGFATEATHRTLHLAFDDLGLHRVVARVIADNAPSVRVAMRLGMRLEAHLVENEWFKGRWIDELDFALLDSEWRSQHEVRIEAIRQGCPNPRSPI
jgi:RimJ/RimL family protein N-acetyltransferase